MKKFYVFIFVYNLIFAETQSASLTIYKDGTALVKQPIEWSLKPGINYKTWNKN